MDKPTFLQLRKVFENKEDKKWENYSDGDLETLIDEAL